ncbi:hypothetical protein GJ496_010863 [Pomphorhynchus laevis]|nr:hypothetical protein GJ496_010863 [Pomphorhynchus laevis]
MMEINADCLLLNSGSFRSDRIHKAGVFKMRTLNEILPMDNKVVLIKCSGQQIMDALENSVSSWPQKEGRFLQVSGIEFSFCSSKPPGNRIITESVKLNGLDIILDEEYTVGIKIYMYNGGDGFDMFKDCEVVMDEESGICLQNAVVNYFEGINQRQSGTRSTLPIVPKSRQNVLMLTSKNHISLKTLTHAISTTLSLNKLVTLPRRHRGSIVATLPDQSTRNQIKKSSLFSKYMKLLENEYLRHFLKNCKRSLRTPFGHCSANNRLFRFHRKTYFS